MDQHVEELQRLRGKMAEVEKRLFDRTHNDALIAKLLKLDGIGSITAITMRAEIARFERFDTGKQRARYCGLTPRNTISWKGKTHDSNREAFPAESTVARMLTRSRVAWAYRTSPDRAVSILRTPHWATGQSRTLE